MDREMTNVKLKYPATIVWQSIKRNNVRKLSECSNRQMSHNYKKTYFLTCALRENINLHVCIFSQIRILTEHILDSQGCKVFQVDNEDTDQTAWMCRLI